MMVETTDGEAGHHQRPLLKWYQCISLLLQVLGVWTVLPRVGSRDPRSVWISETEVDSHPIPAGRRYNSSTTTAASLVLP